MTWILFLLTGLLSGFLSGLLGIGGGVVLVPALIGVFTYLQFPQAALMHFATATSLTIIAMASMVGIYQYARRGLIHFRVVKRLVPGIFIGVAVGVFLANHLSSRELSIIFGVLLIFIAIKTLFFKQISEKASLPHGSWVFCFSVFVGVLSGLLGVGGGVLIIPFLIYFGLPMREASGTSLACTLVIALTGVGFFLLTDGLEARLLPLSSGYIYWPAFFAASVGSIMGVPLGVRLAMILDTQWLERIFGVFLLLVSGYLIY